MMMTKAVAGCPSLITIMPFFVNLDDIHDFSQHRRVIKQIALRDDERVRSIFRYESETLLV